MIERKFVAEQIKEFQVEEFVSDTLGDVGHSHSKMQKTALGERIVIHSSRPGLVVGRKGENIKKLTKDLKKQFSLDNPQIEIAEVPQMWLDAKIVADRIASTLERFGSQRFKGVGHQTMAAVMDSGALGVEILISGKVPSARARRWRFYRGYLKKCGDIATNGVRIAYSSAKLKTGIVGIKVSIMPGDIRLPDDVKILEAPAEEVVEEETKKEVKKAAKEEAKDAEDTKGVEEKSEDAAAQKTKNAGKEATKKSKSTADVQQAPDTEKAAKTEEEKAPKAAEEPVKAESKSTTSAPQAPAKPTSSNEEQAAKEALKAEEKKKATEGSEKAPNEDSK